MTEADFLNTDFARKHPDQFARVLGRGEIEEVAAVLAALPIEASATIVSRLPASKVRELLAFDQQLEAQWLASAPLEDAMSLLSRMPRERSLTLVNSLSSRERRHRLLQYLNYPSHSVGALVTDVPLRVSSELPATEALAEIRGLPAGDPGIVAVVRPDGRYVGTLDVWALLMRDPPRGTIRDYTLPTPAMHPETSLLSAAADKNWQEHSWLAVVDHEQHLLGSITRAKVMSSAGEYSEHARPATDILSALLADIVHLFGQMLHGLLRGRRAS